jgi:site-specific recombinase XerD
MASQHKSRNVGWDIAAQDLLAWYAAYGTRNPKEASGRVKQLAVFFHGWRLADIDAEAVIGYINHRKAQGRANATINADLAVLRRTAYRNVINRGGPERVVMQVMDHKTRSMLDCYAIVSPEDLRDAARRLSDKSLYNLRATGDLVAITPHG